MARRLLGAGQLEKRMNTNMRSSARRSRWQRLEEDRPARILLAEDDDEMRKLLEAELQATVVAAGWGLLRVLLA